MRTLASQASVVALAIVVGALLGATPASAAPGVGVVEVSDDGVTFSRTYPGVLFDGIARLVPGDTESETIYVRNTGTVAGYLRITIRDVSYSDQHYGDALKVTTSTPSSPGNATAISTANPCQVTHEGSVIAPGETVPVVASLVLGNLDGAEGQGAKASLALRFTLTDSTPGSLPATNCGGSGVSIPATPTSPGAPSSSNSTGGFPNGTAATTPSPRSSPTAAALPGPTSGTGLFPWLSSAFSTPPNTWRLYQEYLILILVASAVTGAGISWFLGRRRRKDAEDV